MIIILLNEGIILNIQIMLNMSQPSPSDTSSTSSLQHIWQSESRMLYVITAGLLT